MRNPFDLVLHSNGKLYGTDNGEFLSVFRLRDKYTLFLTIA